MRAGEFVEDVAAEFDGEFARGKIAGGALPQFVQRDFAGALRQGNDGRQSVVAHAVGIHGVFDAIGRMLQAFEDEAVAGKRGQAVEKFLPPPGLEFPR